MRLVVALAFVCDVGNPWTRPFSILIPVSCISVRGKGCVTLKGFVTVGTLAFGARGKSHFFLCSFIVDKMSANNDICLLLSITKLPDRYLLASPHQEIEWNISGKDVVLLQRWTNYVEKRPKVVYNENQMRKKYTFYLPPMNTNSAKTSQ